MDASKVGSIIDHFTSDAGLKAKILQAIPAAKAKGGNLQSILAGFGFPSALQTQILDSIQKVQAGHDLDAVAGNLLADRDSHEALRNNIAYHIGSVQKIVAP